MPRISVETPSPVTWWKCEPAVEAVNPEDLENDDDGPWRTMAEGMHCIIQVQRQIMILVEEQNENTRKIQEVMAHRRKGSDDQGTLQVGTEDNERQQTPEAKQEKNPLKEAPKDSHSEMSADSEINSNGSYVAPLNRTAELTSLNFLAIGNSMANTLSKGPKKEIPSIKEVGIVAHMRARAANMLQHHLFEPAMGSVIFVNSICLGVAIDKDLKGMDAAQMNHAEHFFLVIFILELLLRIFAHGPRCLRNGWNLFDFAIVVIGVLSQWILDPIMQSDHFKDNTLVVEGAQQILILRMLKLLRLVRAVRLVATFKPLWKLTQGFLSSAGTMASSAVMLALTLYIFACIGAEVISKADWKTKVVTDFVNERFSSLPLIMLSLVQFITQDSISGIYFPLVLEKPAVCIYFLALIVFVGLAIMNLITAMLVETAISSATEDKEMEAFYNRQKEKQLKPALKKFFSTLDRTGDNALTAKEIIEDLQGGLEIPGNLKGIVTEARIVELFDHMDHDGNGQLSQDEFVNGMLMVAFSDVPVETKQMLHLLQEARGQMHKLQKYVHHISHTVDNQVKTGNQMKTVNLFQPFPVGHNLSKSTTTFSLSDSR